MHDQETCRPWLLAGSLTLHIDAKCMLARYVADARFEYALYGLAWPASGIAASRPLRYGDVQSIAFKNCPMASNFSTWLGPGLQSVR